MKLNTCTARWENIPTAPPRQNHRPEIRAKARAFGAQLLNRKLSSCGTLSPPQFAGKIYYGNARGAKHSSLDARSYGIKRLVC
jgi:hypothetical protein